MSEDEKTRQDMSDEEISSRRDALRRSHNPYAWHYLFEDEAPQLAAASLELRATENPYATIYFNERGASPDITPAVSKPGKTLRDLVMTQTEFERQCRRIFVAYIPAIEKGKLRPHHREFIERNRGRNAGDRARIVRELKKYDLSSEGGIRTHFNRERDVFTVDKLQQIERAALDRSEE